MNTMKKVLLRGPFLTQSGYGVHSRQIASWIFNKMDSVGSSNLEVNFEVLPWGVTPWLTNTNSHNGLVGRIIQHVRKSESYDISIQVQLPNEWNPFAAEFNVGVTAGVETDICNPDWIDSINRMDLVIVPSAFSRECFVNTATKFGKELRTEVVVIPESFSDAIAESYSNQSELNLDSVKTDFNFLIFGQVTGNSPDNDRKNFGYTMKVLYEAFKDTPNVGVVIKTNAGRNTTADKLHIQNLFSQIQSQLKFKDSVGPKVHILHGEMSDKEVAKLYKHSKIKALLSLTRGEGFGLPILEAAASDLPVIATNWSAHTEFLNQGKWVKVDKELIPVHQSRLDGKIFMETSRWAQVKEADAVSKLKKFYVSPSTPKQWAKELGVEIRKNYSFESISKKYDLVLGDKIV